MSLARDKAVVFVALCAMTVAVYFGTLHVHLFAARTLATAALDRAIPFVPIFVAPYLSFFLLLLLPLWLAAERRQLYDLAFGFATIVALSGVVFLFWPTAIPYPDADALTRMVVAMDRDRNAFPSLHASLAVYCTLSAWRLLRTTRARVALLLWAGLIVVSPLLIKRHLAIDLLGGAVLGCAVAAALLRRERTEAPDSAPVVETLSIRRRLVREVPLDVATLTRRDGRKRAAELLVFPLLAAVGVWLSVHARGVESTPLLLLGIAVTAIALNTFPLLMHEGMHGLLFSNRRWNWIGSVALGSTFLLSFSAYRVMHLRHHRYLGDPRDPDDYHNYARSRFVVWCLHFMRLTVGPLLYLGLIPILALKYGSKADRRSILVEYVLLAAIYSVLLRTFSAPDLFFVWMVPLLFVGMMTAIRGFTQHGITDAADPFLASRTMRPGAIVGFFLLHENYHLEHHLFPDVPSYHLPALHAQIWPKLPRAVSGTSYLAFLGRFLKATPRMDETPIGLVNPDEPTP